MPAADEVEGAAAPAAASHSGIGTRLALGTLQQSSQQFRATEGATAGVIAAGDAAMAKWPAGAAAGGRGLSMPSKLTAGAFKSQAFDEFMSTQAFIADMSRRFASTQQLLHPASACAPPEPLTAQRPRDSDE